MWTLMIFEKKVKWNFKKLYREINKCKATKHLLAFLLIVFEKNIHYVVVVAWK